MNRKIRIAFLIDTINSIGGTEKQLLSLMASLPQERFEKHLISLRPPNAYFMQQDDCYDYHQIGIPSLLSAQCIGRIIELVRYLRQRRIDIVQTYFIDAQFVGILAGKLAGVKKIVCCRRDLGFWHSRSLLMLLRLSDRLVDHFQVNSQAVKRQVASDELVDPGRIHVIYNGIEIGLFNGRAETGYAPDVSGENKNPLRVGILANFNRRVKRVDLFIRAASEVLKTVPGVRFCIAGDGNQRSELKALCQDLGIAGQVDFLGAVTDVPGTIQSWDIGVISSDSEGFCNSILEYMASGLPVVATSVGGNPELVQDGVNGFLVPGGDYRALAEKLCILLNNDRLRKDMGEQGRKIIARCYDWPRVIDRYESFYHEILGYDYERDMDHMGKPEEKPGDQPGSGNQALRIQRD